MTQEQHSFSWSTLGLIFIAALLLLMGWRWDNQAWLRQQADAFIQQQHLPISYASIQQEGAGVIWTDIRITSKKMPPFLIHELHLHLAWSELWHGHLAMRLQASNDFFTVSSLMAQDEDIVQLQSLQLHSDVGKAVAWAKLPLPVQAQGQADMNGTLYLNRTTGMPTNASNLTLIWHNAAISMMQQTQALGNYTLNSQQQEQSIHWTLNGGNDLRVEGNGSLILQAQQLPHTALAGNITIHTKSGTLLDSILGASQGTSIQLSGTLQQPQWKMRPM